VEDGAADMVFLSMVYHHLRDKRMAVQEFRRVLDRDGSLCIRTSTAEGIDGYPWVHFFPSARAIELDRAPSREGLTSTLDARGLHLAGYDVVRQRFARNWDEYLHKIGLRGLSSLKAVADDEFREGMRGLAAYCRQRRGERDVWEDIELFVFRSD
jgi:SAM-dependent methyltransferase